jgi:lipoate-protein ligase A
LKKGVKTPGGHVEVHLNVEKGLITELAIFGDFFVNKDLELFVEALVGVRHEEAAILTRLNELRSEDYFNNISAAELLEAFF